MLLRMFLIKSREPQYRSYSPVPLFATSEEQIFKLAKINNWDVLRELDPNGFDLTCPENKLHNFGLDSAD